MTVQKTTIVIVIINSVKGKMAEEYGGQTVKSEPKLIKLLLSRNEILYENTHFVSIVCIAQCGEHIFSPSKFIKISCLNPSQSLLAHFLLCMSDIKLTSSALTSTDHNIPGNRYK